MPLCYSNFKSFRNKSSRIFWFEQLLFSKVDKLTCKGQVGLGLAGKGRWRANTGWNQLSDVIGSSHATSIKIWGCPCKLCQPYYLSKYELWNNFLPLPLTEKTCYPSVINVTVPNKMPLSNYYWAPPIENWLRPPWLRSASIRFSEHVDGYIKLRST